MSWRRPPEFVRAASTPGYLARIASATRLPMFDSFKRSGLSRLRSTLWVPITLLRSTAVSALALSTIALTSARWGTPRFLARRGAGPPPGAAPRSAPSRAPPEGPPAVLAPTPRGGGPTALAARGGGAG